MSCLDTGSIPVTSTKKEKEKESGERRTLFLFLFSFTIECPVRASVLSKNKEEKECGVSCNPLSLSVSLSFVTSHDWAWSPPQAIKAMNYQLIIVYYNRAVNQLKKFIET